MKTGDIVTIETFREGSMYGVTGKVVSVYDEHFTCEVSESEFGDYCVGFLATFAKDMRIYNWNDHIDDMDNLCTI